MLPFEKLLKFCCPGKKFFRVSDLLSSGPTPVNNHVSRALRLREKWKLKLIRAISKRWNSFRNYYCGVNWWKYFAESEKNHRLKIDSQWKQLVLPNPNCFFVCFEFSLASSFNFHLHNTLTSVSKIVCSASMKIEIWKSSRNCILKICHKIHLNVI